MLKQWWESLQEREQKLVLIGGSFLLLGIFYWGLWAPLGENVERYQKQLYKQQTLNLWAQDAVKQIKSSQGNNNSSGSLQQIVNQTSRQFNIQIGRMNPKGEELNLLIDDAVFNDLLKWLAHLEQQQGVRILNLDVSNTDEPGKVRVPRLVVEKN